MIHVSSHIVEIIVVKKTGISYGIQVSILPRVFEILQIKKLTLLSLRFLRGSKALPCKFFPIFHLLSLASFVMENKIIVTGASLACPFSLAFPDSLSFFLVQICHDACCFLLTIYHISSPAILLLYVHTALQQDQLVHQNNVKWKINYWKDTYHRLFWEHVVRVNHSTFTAPFRCCKSPFP